MDGYYVSTSFTFKGTNLVSITLNAGEGHFEDGTSTFTYKGENGNSYISPVLIAPDGYGFKGWYDEKGVEIYNHKLTSDTTFYAKYVKLVKVTFDAGKGHFANNETIETRDFLKNEHAHYNAPVAPDGLVFCGWYDADGKNLDDIVLTKDMTVYAKYGHNVKLTFDAKEGSFEDGTNKTEKEIAEGTYASYSNPTPPEGFRFLGWFDKDGVPIYQNRVEKDTIFYAKYAKVYNVIFDAKEGHFEDGSTTFTTETTENGYYPYCPTPVGPDGMMFVGWYDVNGKSMYECTIDQKMTFYAKYAKAYDVTFDAQEGHFEDGEKKVVIKSYEGHSFYPGTIIAPEGKVFDGWYDENGNKINDNEYKGNTTYYAHYKDAITITLEPNGGTGNSIQYKLGVGDYQYFSYSNSYFTHPDGKVLVGFKDKKTGKTYALDSGDQFYKDVTLYAQWADPVTVTFDCNGGSTDKGSLIKETCGKNSGLSYDSTLHQTPVKKGKVFTGWHIGSVDGPKLEIYNATFDKDTVLYASYTDAVTLTINYEGLNQESTTVDVAKGDSVSIQNYVNIPDDKYTVGYKIDGVTTGVETYQGVVFDKDTTITVVVANKIKLTYDSNGAGFDAVTQTVAKTNLYGGIFNNVFGKTPEGKYLAGWAVGSPDGKVYTSTAYGVPFSEDTTLYAVWKDGCTINLDLGNGADGYVQSGKTVKKGTSIRLDNIAITQPLEGKELVGWRIDDNEKIIDKYAYYVVNKDITLHAVWADMITVTVQDPETGEVLYTSQIAKGTSFNEGYKVENHLPEGKSLFGWTLDKNKKDAIDLYKTKFDKDVVLYPIYVDSVKVTLDWGNDGGSGHLFGSNSNTFESGKGLALNGFNFNVQSTPKGKKLAGFRIGDTNQIIDVSDSYAQANGNYIINQDTTLHAVWKDCVTVTFNANGEKFENNQEIMKIDYIKGYSNYNGSGTPWEQKNLEGTKVIAGWRIGSPNGPLLKNTRYSEFDSDKTYYAVWSDLFTVTFKNNGIKVAEFNNTNTWTLRNIYYRMTADQSILSDFDDELLVGWYNLETGEKLTEDTVFTKDCVFEARTEKKPVKVILDYNGGFGELKEVTTMGGYFTNEMLSDPYLETPKNKVFVGWSLEKDGDVLKNYYYNPFYVDKDTTLYAKYEDEITLTIHNKDDVYTQKVPVNEWMMFVAGDKCEIEGKTYYSGQPIKFTKNEDVYIKNSSNSSSVTISYRDLTKINGYGFGYSEKFTTWSNFPFNVHENSGTEIKLELNEEFIPEGMAFDKWVTEGNITVKDPTSKKTTFTMPKAENGKRYEIYATFKKEVPIQFEKDSVELTKGEKSQLKVNGDYETLTWSSSDPTTVQVDQSGNIHAVKSGKATIRVTDQKGKRIECVVTVTNKLKSLSLSENKLELKGKTDKKLSVTLSPSDADDEKLTWSSSDEKVVKVSNDGTVTTVSCGEATITVKSESGLTDSCKVTVSHDWKLDSKVDATVDKEGKKVYKCTLCNETKEEIIPKLNGKWVTDSNGKWYQYSDGTYEKSGFKEMNGKTYYFQSNGYVKTGWLLLNNSWYMFNADGSMITGWHGDYYFDENGKMKANAFVEGYYLGADGKYVKNQWIKDGGKDYFMDANGKVKKNDWQGAYYLGSDGAMLTNTFTKDGYYVGSDGAYYTNRWFKDHKKDYFVNTVGKVVKNAWQGAYYLGKDGAMLTNAFTPDGYYVGSDGVYVRNQKVTVDGKVYYLNADGKVAKNQWSGDYYLDGNGNVVKNK
ncbi:InlB B-repeat-containing protein, partial [Holdemanella biformis]|uniref:InlB B-repeat-containing protein n=1 Tax=Holdemanella biformis TaxID=1735 RepID=UPI003AB3D5C9